MYPVYISAAHSVSSGRRVPKSAAYENPTAVGIEVCAKALGWECVIDAGKRHPRTPLSFGRVKICMQSIGERASKQEILRRICEKYPLIKDSLPKENGIAAASNSAKQTDADNLKAVSKPAVAAVKGPGGVVLVAKTKKNKKK